MAGERGVLRFAEALTGEKTNTRYVAPAILLTVEHMFDIVVLFALFMRSHLPPGCLPPVHERQPRLRRRCSVDASLSN